jgi:hypothetical protein
MDDDLAARCVAAHRPSTDLAVGAYEPIKQCMHWAMARCTLRNVVTHLAIFDKLRVLVGLRSTTI